MRQPFNEYRRRSAAPISKSAEQAERNAGARSRSTSTFQTNIREGWRNGEAVNAKLLNTRARRKLMMPPSRSDSETQMKSFGAACRPVAHGGTRPDLSPANRLSFAPHSTLRKQIADAVLKFAVMTKEEA
jgi:hypothetical protein